LSYRDVIHCVFTLIRYMKALVGRQKSLIKVIDNKLIFSR